MNQITRIAAKQNKPKKIRALRALPPTQTLLSTEQTRNVLGVSITTVKAYLERGYLTCVWVGDRRYFYREELEDLVRNGRGQRVANTDTE